MANVRSAYAAVVTGYLNDGNSHEAVVSAEQKVSGWNHQSGELQEMVDGSLTKITISEGGAKAGGKWTISISTDGTLTLGT